MSISIALKNVREIQENHIWGSIVNEVGVTNNYEHIYLIQKNITHSTNNHASKRFEN